MLVIDIETSGIDHNKCCILSIGAVDFLNPYNQFYIEVRAEDGAYIDNYALKINGFTEEQINDINKSTAEVGVSEFLAWVGKCKVKIMAGQNIPFDRDFLKVATTKYNLRWPFGMRLVDLHAVAYTTLLKNNINLLNVDSNSSLTLDNILEYVGLAKEPKPHNGLTGAKVEAEAFSRLIYGKCLLDEYEKYAVPNYLK